MTDKLELIGKSVIQHGPLNDRVYLMKYHEEDYPDLLKKVEDIAIQNNYSKVFAKVPTFAKSQFGKAGYQQEAHVPKFYKGEDDAYFFGKYYEESREREKFPDELETVLDISQTKRGQARTDAPLAPGFEWRVATKDDAEGMVDVYKEIFETYPFPIHDPNYLRDTMDQNFVYFLILDQGKVVAVASSEMDESNLNVEMTDFASLKEYQGKGFATFLLSRMEEEMKRRGIKLAYTIARAYSFGMNITFAKLNYNFNGTLVSNTNIGGKIESMNVWSKYIG